MIANEALALAGSAFILNETAPLTLLVWGPRRVLPVRMQSLSIKEEAFDQKLNPIRAKADLSLEALTYRDLDITNPGYWVYLASFKHEGSDVGAQHSRSYEWRRRARPALGVKHVLQGQPLRTHPRRLDRRQGRPRDPLQAHAVRAAGLDTGAARHQGDRRRPAGSRRLIGRLAIPNSSGGCAMRTWRAVPSI